MEEEEDDNDNDNDGGNSDGNSDNNGDIKIRKQRNDQKKYRRMKKD